MDLFASLQPIHSALDYHLERHNVLASNIAHVDTPGYVPRDLARVDSSDFSASLHVAMASSDPRHLGAPSLTATHSGQVIFDRWEGAGNDRNFVSLDREAGKLATNQIRYDVTSAIMTAELGQIAFAAHDGRV